MRIISMCIFPFLCKNPQIYTYVKKDSLNEFYLLSKSLFFKIQSKFYLHLLFFTALLRYNWQNSRSSAIYNMNKPGGLYAKCSNPDREGNTSWYHLYTENFLKVKFNKWSHNLIFYLLGGFMFCFVHHFMFLCFVTPKW